MKKTSQITGIQAGFVYVDSRQKRLTDEGVVIASAGLPVGRFETFVRGDNRLVLVLQ